MTSISILISYILGGSCLNSDVHVQLQKGYVTQILHSSILDLSRVYACISIPVGYVHKYGSDLVSSDLQGSPWRCMIQGKMTL